MENLKITKHNDVGKGQSQNLDNTTLKKEAKYSINFWRSERKFYLNLYYNRSNGFSFINSSNIHQFQAKNSEIKAYPLRLRSISRSVSVYNMKNIWLKRYVSDFCVDYDATAVDDKLIIHKYFMK